MPRGVRGSTESSAELDVEFRYSRVFSNSATGGKSQIPVIIRGLLDEDIRNFVVAQDLDGDRQEQVVAATADVIYTHLKVSGRSDGEPRGLVTLDGGTIWVLPIGLEPDGELNKLGIAKHSLEDYLIKLLLEDASLQTKIPELQSLLLEILPPIRDKSATKMAISIQAKNCSN
ncbi:MAG: hypothetical protein BZY75_01690 [SAR202 cluster bacterium Io17-Chloro-G7]|nr:MAG: hypothetical protein BZY75_01690 [SAR202 cluster bacterium Io17-Chloro-G7]